MNDYEKVSDDGRMWAVASYAGLLLLLPISIVPLVQRADAYALHHAKHATAVWVSAMVSGLVLTLLTIPLTILTCGVGPLLLAPVYTLLGLWPIVSAIHGLILTINSDWSPPIGSFDLADRMFGSLSIEDRGA